MTTLYNILRPAYRWAGRAEAADGTPHDVYAVSLQRVGVLPAHHAEDALVIARALGHICPIIERHTPPEVPHEVH